MIRKTHSAARPFRILKKWRPLDISFDPSVLMTGHSLVPIRCGDRTSYIRTEKYAVLKSALAPKEKTSVESVESPALERKRGYDERTFIGELKDRKGRRFIRLSAAEPYDTEDESRDELTSNQKQGNEPSAFWSLPRAEEFNPDEWQVVPLPCTPAAPQPPPRPLANASDYETLFILNIRKQTAAKTGKAQKKFQQKMGETWTDRKRLYECGEKLLKDAGLKRHSSDALRPEYRDSCPRCGCSLFLPKNKKLTCYDCGFEWRYGIKKRAGMNQDEGLTKLPKRIVIPRMSAREFVSTLIVAGTHGEAASRA